MMNLQIDERFVSYLWQRHLVEELVTDTGQKLAVCYPGRPSKYGGGDFVDAVLSIDGRKTAGNIEVHVHSGQWYSHGHHWDPRYNNTVLHVAMWDDGRGPARTQNGAVVPSVFLGDNIHSDKHTRMLYRKFKQNHGSVPVCRFVDWIEDVSPIITILERAGMQRFRDKVEIYRKALISYACDQVLYSGIARALGYARNIEPFERLASALPLSVLEHTKIGDKIMTESMVLGTAGLLPSQRCSSRLDETGHVQKLEEVWRSLDKQASMNEIDWCFSTVRPDNYPTRRAAALSYLIATNQDTGILQGLMNLVWEAPVDDGDRWLEGMMIITGSDYWSVHVDFGAIKTKPSALIGRNKAAEIIVNVILPFTTAWADRSYSIDLWHKAVTIYRGYHDMAENEVTGHMRQQLNLDRHIRLTACQHQGLIHLFNTCCRSRNCGECPVSALRD